MSEMIDVQKLANQSAVQIQKMVEKANKATLKFNAQEAKKQREFNKAEASTARSWEEQMSNTAHQREVKDLQEAGLNPVLSANTGAQSYTGASASASAASGQAESGASAMSNILGTMLNSMVGLQQSKMQIEANLKAAQIQASASRYASDRAYEASRYASDRAYEATMDRPASSLISFADKQLEKTGLSKFASTAIGNKVKEIVSDPSKYFHNPSKTTKNNINPTNQGFQEIFKLFRNLGVRRPTKGDAVDFFKFIFFGSPSGQIVRKIQQVNGK